MADKDPGANAYVPLVSGAMSMLGGVFRGLMDTPYNVDPSYVRSLYGAYGDYVPEAEAAAGRIGSVQNPYATGAMWDEEWARQQQQAYMDDLRARASGETSMAREQAAETIKSMQGSMEGEASSTANRFDRGDIQQEAMQQAALVPGQMWAQTEAQALQEQQQAQMMLQQYLSHQQAQNQAAIQGWMDQQNMETQQGIYGGQTGKGYLDLGQQGQAWRRQAGVKGEAVKAQDAQD